MDIGSKYIVFVLVTFLVANRLNAQELNCFDSIQNVNEQVLMLVVNDYLKADTIDSSILLIDYTQCDSLDVFRIVGSHDIFELFYKKPDCYLKYRNSMVYLFTNKYFEKKDTIWLDSVFYNTIMLFNYSNAEVLWAKDSIMNIEGYGIFYSEYTPSIVEYRILEGEILERNICSKMLYPSISKPKGIKIIR